MVNFGYIKTFVFTKPVLYKIMDHSNTSGDVFSLQVSAKHPNSKKIAISYSLVRLLATFAETIHHFPYVSFHN